MAQLRFTILGCGSSAGVPRIGNDWGHCDPAEPKNRRRRCSLLVERINGDAITRVLIDTSPDMRDQLLGAGIGTLLFQLVTKRKVPIFLGSSFAFIAPIIYSIAEWGLPSTMFGLFAAGFMYFVFALLIKWRGLAAVNRLLPPVVIGPVIMVIGLSVAMVASQMAMGQAGGVPPQGGLFPEPVRPA